jgi:lipid-A-disaccharide synthase
LPNVLLGRRAFPELVQTDARASLMAEALAGVLDRRAELIEACEQVRASLATDGSASSNVARMAAPWLRDSRAEA